MDPFLAEIRIFAGNFPPRGWAFCDGSLIPIRSNTALFSLLGTYYGGDGVSTFGLPNLQGSAPMFWGQGAGLSQRTIGQTGGESSVTLRTGQLAGHGHSLNGFAGRGTNNASSPASNEGLGPAAAGNLYQAPGSNLVAMSPSGTGSTGGNQPHNNMQPYLALSFIIALQGIFPQRP